ncbi:MAG: AI-2E family transporter, partial [Pirellulales bacterium]
MRSSTASVAHTALALDATQFVVKLVQGHAAKIDGANFGQFPANKVGHAFCTTGDRPQVQFLIPVVRRPMATPPKTRRRRRTPAVTRSHGKLVVIASATFVSLYLCYRLAVPFLPALVWSVTAAVVTQSLVRWLGRWVKSPARRAAAAVSVVAIALFVPVIGLVTFAAVEISQAVQNLQPAEFFAKWQEAIQGQPRAATAWETISSNLDITRVADQLLAQVNSVATTVVSGSVYSLVMALLTLFMLFFLYRDKDRAMAAVRQLSPFTNAETDRLLTRLDDTIHATIFGIVVVAMIQGKLGGLIFYLLGQP